VSSALGELLGEAEYQKEATKRRSDEATKWLSGGKERQRKQAATDCTDEEGIKGRAGSRDQGKKEEEAGGRRQEARAAEQRSCPGFLGLEENREDDDDALDEVAVVVGHIEHAEHVVDDSEDEHADDGSPDAARAALQACSADDDRRDRVELVEEAGLGTGDRVLTAGDEERGDAAAEAADGVRSGGGCGDGHAGIARGLGVVADGVDAAAKDGAGEDKVGDDGEPEEDQDADADGEGIAVDSDAGDGDRRGADLAVGRDGGADLAAFPRRDDEGAVLASVPSVATNAAMRPLAMRMPLKSPRSVPPQRQMATAATMPRAVR